MYLLDTNVISELRKSKKINANVSNWFQQQPVSILFISVITLLELETGILLMERKDAHQGAVLREWLNQHVLPAFEERILPIDNPVAQCCAKLLVPNPKSERDALIAATALVHGMTVITRNTEDFKYTGVEFLNPWQSVELLL